MRVFGVGLSVYLYGYTKEMTVLKFISSVLLVKVQDRVNCKSGNVYVVSTCRAGSILSHGVLSKQTIVTVDVVQLDVRFESIVQAERLLLPKSGTAGDDGAAALRLKQRMAKRKDGSYGLPACRCCHEIAPRR